MPSCNHCCSGKSISIWVCICSLRYPARNAHAPYCHLLPVRLHSIFPHNLINGTTFGGGEVTKHKCAFRFSLQLLSVTFLTLGRSERDMIKKMYIGFYVKCHLLFLILIKLEFSREIFEKWSNIKFRENPFIGSPGVACGQTNRHDDGHSRFSQFCERA